MSHASCLVVTDNMPTEEELSEILMPWHEFECTGENNKYVQEIDITQKVRDEYESGKSKQVKAPDGVLLETSDPFLYRDLTPEEEVKCHGGFGFLGGPEGFRYDSRDWGDGRGYRPKAYFLPEGYEEVDVPLLHLMSFREYVAQDYGSDRELLFRETPDLDNKHKYGWIKLDGNGNVIQVVNRTNPKAKWDWWVIGGRFSAKLVPDYEPADDPDNIEICVLCDGTGRRLPAPVTMIEMLVEAGLPKDATISQIPIEIRQKHGLDENNRTDCNGCDGKGSRLKWPSRLKNHGNQARWGDIDDAALVAKTAQHLCEEWDKAEAEFEKNLESGDGRRTFGETLREWELLIKELRDSYTEEDREPLYAKINNHPRGLMLRRLVGHAEAFYGIEGVYTREEHVAQADKRALSFFAVVKDGEWFERGEMGWWGVVHDEKEDWPTTLKRILDSIKPDQWVTVIDYHI